MAEMTAIGYFKERERMTHSCKIDCEDCPLNAKENGTNLLCGGFEREHPEKAVAIVRQWAEEHPEKGVTIMQARAKEHPKKTMLSDFLEKHPEAFLREGVPTICPFSVGYEERDYGCMESCRDCWNRTLEE